MIVTVASDAAFERLKFLLSVYRFSSLYDERVLCSVVSNMSAKIEVAAKCEQHSVIRFLLAREVGVTEICKQLTDVYGENAICRSKVYKWKAEFESGRTNVHHETGTSGRPSVITDSIVDLVRNALMSDRRLTISELCTKYNSVGRATMHEIVTECLGFRKICARWVPKELTNNHKENRMMTSLDCLTRYEEDGDEFLDRIVTCDETWISHITPECKRDSMQWKHVTSPRVKKFKTVLSPKKVLATVFWDRRGIIHVEYLKYGNTVNAAGYCETLKRVRRAIQNKRRGMLTDGVVLLHDNATSHTARVTSSLLEQFRWEVLPHPPHSPDLAPSDYHLFPFLKGWLGGQRFDDDEELISAVNNWFQNQAAEWYNIGIENLVSRWDKCLNRYGDYVEK